MTISYYHIKCARLTPNPDLVRRTLKSDDKGGKDFADQMARYADVGVEEVHLMPHGPDPVGFVRGLGSQVIPAVAGL